MTTRILLAILALLIAATALAAPAPTPSMAKKLEERHIVGTWFDDTVQLMPDKHTQRYTIEFNKDHTYSDSLGNWGDWYIHKNTIVMSTQIAFYNPMEFHIEITRPYLYGRINLLQPFDLLDDPDGPAFYHCGFSYPFSNIYQPLYLHRWHTTKPPPRR